LSSTAKVARWFQQLPWHTTSLSRPESGFVSGDSRSEKFHDDQQYFSLKDTDDICDEFLLVEGSSTIWTKLSAKKRRKLLGMRLGKVQVEKWYKRICFEDNKAVLDEILQRRQLQQQQLEPKKQQQQQQQQQPEHIQHLSNSTAALCNLSCST
ncbi:hypothetical protein DOY81_001242, partial [Sarcophaga bullata]